MEHITVTRQNGQHQFKFASESLQADRLGVDFDDLQILTNLLQEDEIIAASVPSLTREHVAMLDELTVRLGLDRDRQKYLYRSRLNDKT